MEKLETVAARMETERILQHLEHLCRLDKLSGGPGAEEACAYITGVLGQEGIPHRIHRFEEYLSNPVVGTLTLEDGTDVPCRPRSFSHRCPDGVEAELVFDPHNRNQTVSDAAWEELLESFRGKIVVSHGFDERYAKRLERHGVLGWIQVWTSGEPLIHEDTVSGIWGTPTQDSSLLLPTIPVIGISGVDGSELERRMAEGPVKALLTVRVETGVFPVVMPEADIPGKSDEFVLVSCHYDSWYLGAVDNCVANAAALEMARVLWQHRDELERSVRILWWTGHSNGRYAGSTWYCDQNWMDIRKNCVAHINSDLAGAMGTDRIAIHTTGAEGRDFSRRAAESVAPGIRVDYYSIGKGADQSFWGPEVPFHLYSRSVCAPENRRSATPGSGDPAWHTPQDTLDKVDPEALERDARMFFQLAWQFAAEKELPFDGEGFFASMEKTLQDAASDCDPCFDFSPVLEALRDLRHTAERAVQGAGQERNRAVRRICGVMNRMRQSYGSPYDFDLAFASSGIFPRLCSVRGKRRESMKAEEFLFLYTDFVRQRNRLLYQMETLRSELEY